MSDPTPWYQREHAPRTLTVIGGSSPFTLALVAAIADDPPWAEGTLVLQGRDHEALDIVARCGDHELARAGWQVEGVPDLDAAIDRADVVLHQNRYGGLAWREEDERLAVGLGLAPDETIGPAGLAVSLRTGHGQRPYAVAIARRSSSLPVLTMTNPLGVSTAHFAAAGLSALGLCELPEMTRLDIAAAAGVPEESLSGSYTGLNHRGFWHHLQADGTDVIAVMSEAGEGRHGWDGPYLRRLEAVPDKYHALLRGRSYLQPGRAAELAHLRSRIQEEAAAEPHRLPASLTGRDMPWHRIIVLPVLRALAGGEADVIVTRQGADGIADERRVRLHENTIAALPGADPPTLVGELHTRMRVHEAATMAAVDNPVPDLIWAALDADPTVPADQVARATSAVCADFARWLDTGV